LYQNMNSCKEENLRVTPQKVKQQPGWENISDEMTENMANTIRRLAELFYITIAREQSLTPLPGSENETENLVPKKRTQNRKVKN
jgi:hypothetical protein